MAINYPALFIIKLQVFGNHKNVFNQTYAMFNLKVSAENLNQKNWFINKKIIYLKFTEMNM